jgi:FKBP-type peptidyl-prolyl cis-trans isomerase
MNRILAALAGLCFLLTVSSAMAADPALSTAANAAFLAANAKKAGVITRPDGLQYRIIKNGFGKQAHATDTVTVEYKGSLINGKVFDATEPGLPATFQVNQLIKGWTEALELMRVGDHWQIVIPASLGYGTRGAGEGTIPPNQTLVFDLTLIAVEPPPPAPPGGQGGAQQ